MFGKEVSHFRHQRFSRTETVISTAHDISVWTDAGMFHYGIYIRYGLGGQPTNVSLIYERSFLIIALNLTVNENSINIGESVVFLGSEV